MSDTINTPATNNINSSATPDEIIQTDTQRPIKYEIRQAIRYDPDTLYYRTTRRIRRFTSYLMRLGTHQK